MAPPKADVSYKKQNGIIAISKDRKSVSWSPSSPSDASPTLVISASNITNLQQTPESSAKVMLKIFVQDPGQTEAVSHVFTFISTVDPRSDANNVKDALTNVIQAQKAAINAATELTPAGGQSAAMTIASAISGARGMNAWEDDERLKADVKLQQSLMNENPELQKTFMEALRTKSESISNSQFTSQFWSSRVHLLRAHAIAQNQGRGKYNVFSELRREEGGTKLNLTQDHVRVIFEQYPVMRKIYDEVVPHKCKSEVEFWSRFFQSQLFMTLRGLKFDRNKEQKDPLLDKYLDYPELTGLRPTSSEQQIPKFIDLEGNEENHSQRKGNRPDTELRSSTLDKAPIIRKLNALSEKLMASVRPSDVDASAPIGMDEATYDELRLRDLAGDPEQQRLILNVQDQSRFFSHSGTSDGDDALKQNPYKNIDPSKAIKEVYDDVHKHFLHPGQGVIPIETFDDAYDEEQYHDESSKSSKQPNSGSFHASEHIMTLIQAHRNQTAAIPVSSGLSSTIYDRLTLTHATTIEFLRQFWSAFLSGDPLRANEIASLVESLNRALDRTNAIAEDAEKEREATIRRSEKEAVERYKRTGKRSRVDYKSIGGGSAVVKELLGPIIRSLGTAVNRYKEAFEQQSAEGVDGDGVG